MEVNSCISQDDQQEIISKVDGCLVVDDDHEGPLPGFRFHPTDEELVSFYLKRKVEKRRPLSIEIIKQIDIYKYDPWDLAKASSSIGDKEWYFYCKRGRKYRNSIRPNRVTGSGFWKATGIDRPIYCNEGEGHQLHQCIGLKKSLVYYRGSAGKGTKTDWMMHEFRLPNDLHQHDDPNLTKPKDTLLEAEIWTLCRIFKRNKRHTPDWRELSSRKNAVTSSSKTSSIDSSTNQPCYISFQTHQVAPNIDHYSNLCVANDENSNVLIGNQHNISSSDQKNVGFQADHQRQWNSIAHNPSSTVARPSILNHVLTNNEIDLQSFAYYEYNWDDLNSVVDHAVKQPFL